MGVKMKLFTDKKRMQLATEMVFYLLVFMAITCFAMIQTFGDPPDEINRFKIVNYIMLHGKLPHGADPQIRIAGYGASYGFQPILTYIIQGYFLRFLRIFTMDGYILLLAARLVNAFFGLVMAYFVRETAKEVWNNPWLQWSFTIMVVFLPQNIFIHSYINTDSMAMMAVAIICYVLLRAQRTGYGKKECILLAVGIITCAMSYYNAYGIILAAIIIFLLHYVKMENGKIRIAYRSMLRAGLLITVLVLIGIGWWFVRNGILYEGDIIAMEARRLCAMETALAEYNPSTRFTYAKAGIPLMEMFRETQYWTLVRDSFIAMFGPMIIPTHGLIYLYYKRFWIVTALAAAFPLGIVFGHEKRVIGWNGLRTVDKKDTVIFYMGMVLFCVITIVLSVYYSYTWELQPQGRYILPVLVPLMYLVTLGMGKIGTLLAAIPKVGLWLGRLFCVGVMAYVMLAFAYSVFVRFIPYYMERENMFSMWGKAFVL